MLRDITKDDEPSDTLEGVGVPAILDDIERLVAGIERLIASA